MTQNISLAGPLAAESALAALFSLSVLTVTKGNASKQLLVGAGGRSIKGQGSLAITAGSLEHVQVAGLEGLAQLLTGIRQNQALVHGIVKGSRPGEVHPLVTTEALKQAKAGTHEPGTVARTLEYIAYAPDLFLLMFDRDDNPEDPTKVTTSAELTLLLAPLLPGIEGAGRLFTTSTSSGIKSKATDEWLLPPTGSHTYVLARGNLQRFVELFTIRLWNAGYGYCKLATPNTQTGVAAVLTRAVVDLSVFSAERLDYVSGARIARDAPFYQDRGEPELVEGTILDLDALPDVTPEQRHDYTVRVAAAKASLAPARFRMVKAAIETAEPALPADQVAALAEQRLAHQEEGFLPADFLLYFYHRKKAVAVQDLSAAYDGLRLADPAEPDYRDGTDAIFHWRGGHWLVNSFAHGLAHTYRAVPEIPPAPDEDDTQDLLRQAAGEARTGRNGSTPGPPQGSPEFEGPLPYSDYTNALAFVRDHGQDLRYCYPWNAWLVWTGTHWQRDTSGEVMRRAKQTVKRLARRAEALDDRAAHALLAHVKASLSTAKLKAMIENAQSEPGVAVQPAQLDTDVWALNVANGTLALKTGTLRPHARADLLTKCLTIPYDAQATCPTWDAFLWRIMGGSQGDSPEMSVGELAQRQEADERPRTLIGFLQKALGYSLTGSTREQCFFLLHGPTKTGKSTFLHIAKALLGPYGTQAEMSTFLHKDRETVRNDLADLAGMRLVCAIETEEGKRLAEALIKQLTGGTDTIKARFLFEEYFEYRPQFKVFLATNHKPKVTPSDDALWERIRLIPFVVQIPVKQRNKQLDGELCAELPGILAWAVRGCLAWQGEDSLQEPAAVVEATQGYRDEMDTLAQFLEECCTSGDATYVKVKATAVVSAYQAWCKRTGESPLANLALIAALEDRGYTRQRGHANQYYWHGFGLVNTSDGRYEAQKKNNAQEGAALRDLPELVEE